MGGENRHGRPMSRKKATLVDVDVNVNFNPKKLVSCTE